MKLVVVVGLILSMSSYLVFFLFYIVAHDGAEVVLPSSDVQNHYLIRLGDLPGLHPDENMLNRDISIYKQRIPFVYEKIYEDKKPIQHYIAYLKGDMHFIQERNVSLLKIGDQQIAINRKED